MLHSFTHQMLARYSITKETNAVNSYLQIDLDQENLFVADFSQADVE